MKKIFPSLTSLIVMVFILTFGLEYTAEDMSEPQSTGNKTMTNEDIQHLQNDKDHATVNQMPVAPGMEGMGAGGVNKGSDNSNKDSDQSASPVENAPTKSDEGSGAGSSNNEPYYPSY